MRNQGLAPSPTVRRLPTPLREPPYDDERDRGQDAPAAAARRRLRLGDSALTAVESLEVGTSGADADSVQGTLALAFVLPSGLPTDPPGPRLRLVPAALDDEDSDERADDGVRLPDPREWSGRLVQAMLEVLMGRRPAHQLVRWTNSAVHAEITRRIASPATGMRAARITLKSIHVSQPAPNVAEVCAVVCQGPRVRAIALRLEGFHQRWRATVLQFG